jgi:amino acid adenylation domain-containing protein
MHDQITTGFRISPQQRQVWLTHQAQACSVGCLAWIDGPLDASGLAKAVQQVVQRHEILRTIFRRPAGMKLPLQVIGEAQPVALDVVDLRAVPRAEQEQAIEETWQSQAGPFDLEQGPLVRAKLARVAEARHALLFALPAMIADGQTLCCLVREMGRFYAGGGPGDDVPDQPFQYADFAEWQNELAEGRGEEAQTGRAYWKAQNLSAVPALAVPFQSRLAPAGAFVPFRTPVRIPPEIASRIDATARDLGATPEALLLACWQALLWRMTGQDHFVLERLYDGRAYEEVQGAMGPFARVLPLRCGVQDRSFAEWVIQAAGALAESRRWHEYAPDETTTASVGFGLESVPAPFEAGGATFAVQRISNAVKPYALQFLGTWAGGSVDAHLSYDARLLRAEDVRHFAAWYERLLDGGLARPDSPLGSTELLDPMERHCVVVEFNQTATDYAKGRCIHHLFEQQAARTPDRPALAYQGRHWSYADLNAAANRLARHLVKCGVGPGAPVGLCVERSGQAIIGLLGILKAGGAYVPMQPEHPQGRLAHQLAETRSRVLVTREELLGRLPSFSGQVVCLDRDATVLDGMEASNPEWANRPHELAYVCYTSGSTGLPKGVAVRHQNLVNYAQFVCRLLGQTQQTSSPGLHFATVSTLGADLGNTCIFPALISGGCLHVIDQDTSMDSRRFANYVGKNPIDVLKITPSHLGSLLATPEGRGLLPARYLIFGGEALSWELALKVRELGTCAIINHYGPTETTVGSLTFPLEDGEAARRRSATVPIGRPIANTAVYVLDTSRNPVPVGVPGELYIGGEGVTAGYLNQPEQTADRFVADPFSGRTDARLYRTGDRSRWLPDGTVEFLGRVDHQVKLRGYRVEPGEIEAALCRHRGIRQAIVVPRQEGSEKRLVAYWVAANGQPPGTDELRAFLAKELPEYMVPSILVPLKALPLTPNGKVDRDALPDPNAAGLTPERSYVGPRTPVEVELAGIWAEILQIERVGVTDDFFELGGHSLLATQVVSRVRRVFNVEVPLRAMFETPTVAGLAELIAQLGGGQAQEDEMNRLLAELENMPEEEVQRLLALETEQGQK